MSEHDVTRPGPTRWSAVLRSAPLFFAALVSCAPAPPSLGTFEIESIVREIAAEPEAWETVRGRADGAPRVEVMCPSVNAKTDGVDMPTLVVPPPGEIRLMLGDAPAPPGSGPLRLVTRVGVDQRTFSFLTEARPRARFSFELRSGARVLAREEIELVHGRPQENAWLDFGGKQGVVVEGLREVTLLTEALLSDGTSIELPAPVHVGFGGLRLVRSIQRERTRSSPDHPSVILVLMDTLRLDRLSTYGYARPTSPHLTELARRGVQFETCYSTASWTWPATASILTGLTTMEHGLIGESSSYLFEQSATLAESLQLAGFTCAAWSGNPIVSSRRNFDQGFEHFRAPESGDMQETDEFFEEVRTFLRERQGTRFFLYLHLADPHTPHRPLEEGVRLLAPDVPPAFRAKCDGLWRATDKGQGVRPGGEVALDGIASAEERRWTSEIYDASVWSGDYWLGELMRELAALGLEDETVLAFTSDHGEELFERGFFGHGHSLKQELVRVPLVLAGPGVPVGQRNPGLVSSRMIGPLLARLGGVAFGDGAQALQQLARPEQGDDLLLFTTTRGWWKGRDHVRIAGLTDGKWKLNLALDGAPWGSGGAAPDGDLELYDLEHDPDEREDLAARQPEMATRLRSTLLERIRALEARRVGTDMPAGEATLRAMEHLGYMGAEDGEEH